MWCRFFFWKTLFKKLTLTILILQNLLHVGDHVQTQKFQVNICIFVEGIGIRKITAGSINKLEIIDRYFFISRTLSVVR